MSAGDPGDAASGPSVPTLRGPVLTAQLGATLMHEHVFVLTPELQANYPTGWDVEQGVADAVVRIGRLRALGIDTIVDPTVVGLGRSIALVQRVAAQVDVHIIAATGLYTYDALPHQFAFAGPGTPFGGEDPLEGLFLADIEEGIAGTGVRAAFLKCAIDRPGLTPGVERVMRAVARVHRRSGRPITVHTDAASRSGVVVQDVLRSEGVDLRRVVLGHCGDSTDIDYLMRLADEGSTLGMDRFGLDVLLPLDERVATVARLCAAGYADRMVLSHDASCYIDWFPPGAPEEFAPRWHYEHISHDVLPALRALGVSEAQITSMMVTNPRRYFERVEPY